MIINTETIRARLLTNTQYLAIYGTQVDPWSTNYDFADKEESKELAAQLLAIAQNLSDLSAEISDKSERLT